MKTPRILPLLLTLACWVSPAPAQSGSPAVPATPAPVVAAPAVAPDPGDASSPVEKKDNGAFRKRHEAFLARGKSGPIDLLFLGDSITAHWADVPHIWSAYYEKYRPANFGIGGDRTQHVIWRIEQGELDGIHPRVVVLMLGTNNSVANTGAEILAADTKIVRLIQAKIPEAKILLLGIFPRGASKPDPALAKIVEQQLASFRVVNLGLAKLDDGHKVRFLDIGSVFLGKDGQVPFSIMPDQLHPSAAGYQLWADAMKPLLDTMMSTP